MQNEKRQLQTALVVEQRVRRNPRRLDSSFTENASEIESDTVSDDVDGDTTHRNNQSGDEEECFLDCEPAYSANLDAVERSSSQTSTRSPTSFSSSVICTLSSLQQICCRAYLGILCTVLSISMHSVAMQQWAGI